MIAPTSAVEENEEKSQRRHDSKRQAPLLRAEAYWAANLSRASLSVLLWSVVPWTVPRQDQGRGSIKDAAGGTTRTVERRGLPHGRRAARLAGAAGARLASEFECESARRRRRRRIRGAAAAGG